MKEKQSKGNGWGVLGLVGVLLLSVFCCGGPALIAVLGTAGIGAIFAGAGGVWWIFGILAALVVVIAALMIRRSQKHMEGRASNSRGTRTKREDCCAPTKITDRKHETK